MLHDMQVPIDEPLATPVNPEKHKETEGLVVAQIYSSSTMLPFSETYMPSRNYHLLSANRTEKPHTSRTGPAPLSHGE